MTPYNENLLKKWAEGEGPSACSMANAHDLLRQLEHYCLCPATVERGYWPMTIFIWKDTSFDIEIFDDRIELNVRASREAGFSCGCYEYESGNAAQIRRLIEDLKGLLTPSR